MRNSIMSPPSGINLTHSTTELHPAPEVEDNCVCGNLLISVLNLFIHFYVKTPMWTHIIIDISDHIWWTGVGIELKSPILEWCNHNTTHDLRLGSFICMYLMTRRNWELVLLIKWKYKYTSIYILVYIYIYIWHFDMNINHITEQAY